MDNLLIESKINLKEVKQTRCKVWWVDSEDPLLAKLCWTKAKGEAVFTEKGMPAFVAMTFSVMKSSSGNGADITEAKHFLKWFYTSHGPLFKKKEITLFEVLTRMKGLVLAINIFNSTLLEEGPTGMKKRRDYANFLDEFPLAEKALSNIAPELENTCNDYKWWTVNPFSRADELTFALMPVLSSSNYPVIKFPQPPKKGFATKEEKFQWARPYVYNFLNELLKQNTSILFNVDEKGRPIANINIVEIYTFAIASRIYYRDIPPLKECDALDCNLLVKEGQEYCNKHLRRYGEGSAAKQRVLTYYRKRKERGHITLAEYERLKIYLNNLKLQGIIEEEDFKRKAELYLEEIKEGGVVIEKKR